MQNILRPSNDPLGGFVEIYFVPDINVDAIEYNYTNTVTIDLATGKKFYKMECVHATAEAKFTGKNTMLGKLYDIEVNALVAGNYADNGNAFDELLDYRFLIATKDNNCNYKIFGSTEQPLEFTIVSSSKNEASQRKETQVKFFGQCYVAEKTPSATPEVYPD